MKANPFPPEATPAPAPTTDLTMPPRGEGAHPHRINPYRMFTGAMVPNWLLRRPELSQGAKLTYARLSQYAGEDGRCFPRQTTLGRELGVSDRNVRNYLRELEGARLIASEQHGLGRTNDYYFLDHPWIHEGAPGQAATSVLTRQIPAAPDRQTSSGPTEEEIQKEESQEKSSTTHTRLRGLPTSEGQAAEWAGMEAVPPDFARQEFNRLVGIDWIDGCGRAVTSWRHYIKGRWAKEQSERAERAARPRLNGTKLTPPRQFQRQDYTQPVTNY